MEWEGNQISSNRTVNEKQKASLTQLTFMETITSLVLFCKCQLNIDKIKMTAHT